MSGVGLRNGMDRMRERLSLDRNWKFAHGHAADAARDFGFAASRCLVKAGEARGAAGKNFDDSKWREVNVPHDWAIELPLDPKGEKELCEHGFRAIGPTHPDNSVGWYRRRFAIPKTDLGRRISIEFDGVFRDSIVWVNGHRLGRNESGYTGFRYDVTDLLQFGGSNILVVRVDATDWEGWWYEGAGIYRHVWLIKTDAIHIAPCGTFVASTIGNSVATVTIQTNVANDGDERAAFDLISSIEDANGKVVGVATTKRVRLEAGASKELSQRIEIESPLLWSCDVPNLYKLRSVVKVGGRSRDEYLTPFGIRSLRWDSKRGFFLNGKPLKIKGTCNHQHHAGAGVALPDRIHEFRIEKLKELGSNAYRCSHYAVAPEVLDACDRHGLLVMAENRRAGSSGDSIRQFESMIVRDRNHPSIILWSIGNEEHSIQWAEAGERIGKTMVKLAHRLDPTRKVTAAMHDRGLNEGFANIVDVHGWNYIHVGNIEAFHRRRPEQPVVGSEEGSTVCTRGIYADDAKRGYVSAYDLRAPKWGSTAKEWWSFFSDRQWIAGGFVWTGFDYFGEPIPYQWPCTASHFGLMDLCGFPKDLYYYFKAWWSDQTVLHFFPHWNWTGKRTIDVWCFSNCEEVELLLNGTSLGRKMMKRNSHLAWPVMYEPGMLEGRGFRNGKQVIAQRIETTGSARRLVLEPDRKAIRADREDVVAVLVSAVDAAGRSVPTADNVIHFDISANGELLGVGNGDPSSHDPVKKPTCRLFNGRCQVLIQSGRKPGVLRVRGRSSGLAEALLEVRLTRSRERLGVPQK
jgi:beta-galactosidase